MSKHYLRKLDDKMGKAEYEMERAYPAEEPGIEIPAHHMTYDEWREFLKMRIDREFDKKNQRAGYFLYLEDYPIGIINLSDKIDEDNGNIGYSIRPICRGKGLAVVMLNLLKDEAKKRGISKLVGHANEYNVASWKTMEKCGFKYIGDTDWGSKRYEFKISL